MKNLLFSLTFFMSVLQLHGQTDLPTYGYNYQAVIRDASGQPAANQSVQLRFQILNTGNAKLYEETHTVVTDAFGRAVSVVGTGTALFGKFDTLNWVARKHFLGVAVKLGSAANWVEMGKGEMVLQPAVKGSINGNIVGIAQLSGFNEGGIYISKSTWQRVTRVHYDELERNFDNLPKPANGITREYWLGIRKGDNLNPNCGANGSEWRFFLTKGKAGHKFNMPFDWGGTEQGNTNWIQIPPMSIYPDAAFPMHWILEARIPECVAGRMEVQGIWLMAVDKPNGTTPALNIDANNTSGEEGQTAIFGNNPGQSGGIIMDAQYVRIYGSDLVLGTADGRPTGSKTDQRALVHDINDVLHLNYNGDFEGGVHVGGSGISAATVTVRGSDRAHRFNTTTGEKLPAGTVVVFDETHPGKIRPCTTAYDRKIPRIISDESGTGKFRPGIVHEQEDTKNGPAVALDGTVEVFAFGPIAVGDYLTTSHVPGYAMKAQKRRKAQGAIIGSAITALKKGEKGKVEIWVERR